MQRPDRIDHDAVPRGLWADRAGDADTLTGVYDRATLAAIDAAAKVATPPTPGAASPQSRGNPQGSPSGEASQTGRHGLGAASLAGALWMGALVAVGEVMGDEPRKPKVAWYVPAPADPDTQAITVDLVAGSPAASMVVVRPWLLTGH